MNLSKHHKLLGVLLLLPFIAWSLTGIFFLFRPAYAAAYAQLLPQTYPLEESVQLQPQDNWLEFRYLKTVLGEHLLVRDEQGWKHLDPRSGLVRQKPNPQQLQRLLADAIAVDSARYGHLLLASEDSENGFITSSGVEITLNWNQLAFYQRGRDTQWIDWVYDIHYLRWTGVDWLDDFVGLAGLLLLLLMTLTGTQMLLRKPL